MGVWLARTGTRSHAEPEVTSSPMIFGRAIASILLIAAASACASSCESEKEKSAREEKARSERHLARLLRTKECVHCDISDAQLRGRDLRGIKLEQTALHGDLRGANLTGARIINSALGEPTSILSSGGSISAGTSIFPTSRSCRASPRFKSARASRRTNPTKRCASPDFPIAASAFMTVSTATMPRSTHCAVFSHSIANSRTAGAWAPSVNSRSRRSRWAPEAT